MHCLAILAVMSAVFGALTTIFAKIGIENVNSYFATFIRAIVILSCLSASVRWSACVAAMLRQSGAHLASMNAH